MFWFIVYNQLFVASAELSFVVFNAVAFIGVFGNLYYAVIRADVVAAGEAAPAFFGPLCTGDAIIALHRRFAFDLGANGFVHFNAV